jgi:hypothetical protein
MAMKRLIFTGLVLALILASGCAKEIPGTDEEYCAKTDTEKLSLAEAKEIAIASECGSTLKETYMCNQDTGTWWIDLDIEKQGCNPACVVNVATKQAEINWRCTGAIPE